MESYHHGRQDIGARVVKADYDVSYIPYWNPDKFTRSILKLGQ